VPQGHIHTIHDDEKVPQTAILVPLVHFIAHQGHVNGFRERREVVLDHIHVCRDHIHMSRGDVHPTEAAMKVSERRVHGPKSHVFPIDGHERLPFDRKEVVPDHVNVCRDHFHVPGENIHATEEREKARKGSIHPLRQPGRP
jgi:hypothetical protein